MPTAAPAPRAGTAVQCRGDEPACTGVPPRHPRHSGGAGCCWGCFHSTTAAGSLACPRGGPQDLVPSLGAAAGVSGGTSRCLWATSGRSARRVGGRTMGPAKPRPLRHPGPAAGKEEGPGLGQWAVALTQTTSSWSLPLPTGWSWPRAGRRRELTLLGLFLRQGASVLPCARSHGQGGVAAGTLAPGR